jgi:hypothetical protein
VAAPVALAPVSASSLSHITGTGTGTGARDQEDVIMDVYEQVHISLYISSSLSHLLSHLSSCACLSFSLSLVFCVSPLSRSRVL